MFGSLQILSIIQTALNKSKQSHLPTQRKSRTLDESSERGKRQTPPHLNLLMRVFPAFESCNYFSTSPIQGLNN